MEPIEPSAKPKPASTRLTVTVAETCRVTGLGNTKVYELLAEGKLKSVAIGRRRLIFVNSIYMLLGEPIA